MSLPTAATALPNASVVFASGPWGAGSTSGWSSTHPALAVDETLPPRRVECEQVTVKTVAVKTRAIEVRRIVGGYSVFLRAEQDRHHRRRQAAAHQVEGDRFRFRVELDPDV